MFRKILQDRTLLLLIFVGTLLQISIIFPSGTLVDNNYLFWGAQHHDALWHIALMKRLSYFSFENPVFAGESLGNYHYLMNLILGIINRISGIPIFLLVYKIFPLIIAPIIGILTFIFSKELFNSRKAGLWSVFFIYFGSSFAYLLPLLGLGSDLLETSFWAQQQISMFFNLPYAASIPILFAALLFLQKYLSNKSRRDKYLTIVFFSLLPVTKSFAGVFLIGLTAAAVFRFLYQKNFDLLFISVFAILLSILLLSPTLKFGDQHLIYQPGWFLETMMVVPDRIGVQDWALKLEHYRSVEATHWIVWMYILAFLIFFVGNLGTRIVAIFNVEYKELLYDPVHQLLLTSAVIFLVIPLLFLTSGIAWNSIQFLYYLLLITGIYAGNGVRIILNKFKNGRYRLFIGIIIIILTIPVNLSTLNYYYSRTPETIPLEEYRLLESISKAASKDDIVLTIPLERSFIEVPAVTGVSTVLGDELMAVVPGHDYGKRYDRLKYALESSESFLAILDQYGIDWVYIKDSAKYDLESISELNLFLEKGDIRVYQVDKK